MTLGPPLLKVAVRFMTQRGHMRSSGEGKVT